MKPCETPSLLGHGRKALPGHLSHPKATIYLLITNDQQETDFVLRPFDVLISPSLSLFFPPLLSGVCQLPFPFIQSASIPSTTPYSTHSITHPPTHQHFLSFSLSASLYPSTVPSNFYLPSLHSSPSFHPALPPLIPSSFFVLCVFFHIPIRP